MLQEASDQMTTFAALLSKSVFDVERAAKKALTQKVDAINTATSNIKTDQQANDELFTKAKPEIEASLNDATTAFAKAKQQYESQDSSTSTKMITAQVGFQKTLQ